MKAKKTKVENICNAKKSIGKIQLTKYSTMGIQEHIQKDRRFVKCRLETKMK